MSSYARLIRPTARQINHLVNRFVIAGLLLLGIAAFADIGSSFADAARKPLLQAGKKTIYERVLTQPGATIHDTAGQTDAGKPLPTMSILYVYARQNAGGGSWIEVGPNADGKTIGWTAEQEALPWKQQLTLAFTNPAGRERGLMFGQRDALDKLLMADKPGDEAAKLRQVIASGNVPDGFPVIAMEPQNYIDISKQFYLLPILEAQDAAMGMGYPVRELHIASVPADTAASKPAADASQEDMLSNFTAGVVFVVDSTKSMDPYIDRTRQAVEKMYDQIQGKMVGSRASFGLVAFRAGAKEDKSIGYDSKVFVDPNKVADKKTFLAAVKGLSASKVSTPRFSEDSYAGIMTALNDIDWSHFGARYIVLVTDAGALDGNDKFSSTKLDADQVRLFAQERGVAIYALHLLTKEGVSNHDQAAAQYKTVSTYPNLAKPLYYPIADGSVTQFGNVVDLLSQAIVTQVSDAASGKTAVGADAPAGVNAVESQVASDTAAVGYAMRLAYLGRVSKTTAPKLVEAWTVDRDFAKPDVAPLADIATRDNVSVRTKSHEIETVRLLDRALTSITAVIVGLGAAGAAFSVAASQWANVERQRKDVSMLRLLGLRRSEVLLLPVAQSLIIALIGYGISALLFIAVAVMVNNMFSLTGMSDSPVCRLDIKHFIWFWAVTISVAGLAALVGGAHVVKIDPSESLRAV